MTIAVYFVFPRIRLPSFWLVSVARCSKLLTYQKNTITNTLSLAGTTFTIPRQRLATTAFRCLSYPSTQSFPWCHIVLTKPLTGFCRSWSPLNLRYSSRFLAMLSLHLGLCHSLNPLRVSLRQMPQVEFTPKGLSTIKVNRVCWFRWSLNLYSSRFLVAQPLGLTKSLVDNCNCILLNAIRFSAGLSIWVDWVEGVLADTSPRRSRGEPY